VGIATAPFLWFTALASIPVLPLAAMGQPRWLASYPVLGAMALLASSAGIGLTLALFRVAGARRTREIGQMLAALIGATFFLIIQARSLLPDGGERLFGGVLRWARSGVFAPDAPLAWPARAMLGEPLPLVTLVAASLLVFAAMAAGLGRRFSSNVAAAAGASTASGRVSRGAVTTRRFRGGAFRAILRKEFALMRRDPTLPAQGLLRALYVAPLTFAMLKAGSGGGEADTALHLQLSALAGSVAFLAGQIAGALAWTCISAEDAPELMTCAPVEARLAQRAKLAAVLIPVALVLGAPIMVLVWLSPWIGLCALAAATGAAVSSVLINLRLEPPSQRRAFSGRPNGSALTAIAEILASMGWAVAAWMGATDTVWGLVPAAVVIGGVATLHLSPRRAR
jgi:ABC-2 type transport system permease protein